MTTSTNYRSPWQRLSKTMASIAHAIDDTESDRLARRIRYLEEEIVSLKTQVESYATELHLTKPIQTRSGATAVDS